MNNLLNNFKNNLMENVSVLLVTVGILLIITIGIYVAFALHWALGLIVIGAISIGIGLLLCDRTDYSEINEFEKQHNRKE